MTLFHILFRILISTFILIRRWQINKWKLKKILSMYAYNYLSLISLNNTYSFLNLFKISIK